MLLEYHYHAVRYHAFSCQSIYNYLHCDDLTCRRSPLVRKQHPPHPVADPKVTDTLILYIVSSTIHGVLCNIIPYTLKMKNNLIEMHLVKSFILFF